MFQQILSCLKLVLWVFINPHLSSTTPPEFMHTLGFMQPQALATKIRHRCGKGRGWAVSVVVLVDGRFPEMLDNATWERGFWSVGEETSCVSFCPSKHIPAEGPGHWKGCGMPGKCQQASFWHLYMKSKHNPPTIPMSCFCQEKSFVTLSSCCSASPAGLA